MLARDQIRMVAQEIGRTAEQRMHHCDDRFDQQQLWEVVRRACHAIEAVTEMDGDGLQAEDRSRRAHYLLDELESAVAAARRVKVVLDWTTRRAPDDF
ncbi:MAG: hypothetical protein IRZ00_13115 [Gemmatimonadetes bacterium]|nr:hypothetical protein [Gemmatimonadota bacterium]